MKDPKKELEKARSRFAQEEDKKKFFRKPTKKEVYRGFFSILVFLIILGSLSWLAYFAYNGMQSVSRINDTKTIYSQTIKYILRELEECKFGGATVVMDGNITCSGNTAAKTVTAAVSKMKDKNPYVAANNAVRSSTSNTNDEDVGFINLSASGSNVIVKSCYKTPCNNSANSLIGTINCEKIKKMIRGNMCSFKSYQE